MAEGRQGATNVQIRRGSSAICRRHRCGQYVEATHIGYCEPCLNEWVSKAPRRASASVVPRVGAPSPSHR